MGKGRGGCIGLGGGEGMLFSGEPGALSEELEVKVFFREYEDTEGMKNEEEKFLI